MLLSLDEGVQFRLGQIETVGLNARLESELRSTVRSGDVMNLRADFYQNHKSELPEAVLPEDSQFRCNIKEKTVDALFDFRSCSQLLQNLKVPGLTVRHPVSKRLLNALSLIYRPSLPIELRIHLHSFKWIC